MTAEETIGSLEAQLKQALEQLKEVRRSRRRLAKSVRRGIIERDPAPGQRGLWSIGWSCAQHVIRVWEAEVWRDPERSSICQNSYQLRSRTIGSTRGGVQDAKNAMKPRWTCM